MKFFISCFFMLFSLAHSEEKSISGKEVTFTFNRVEYSVKLSGGRAVIESDRYAFIIDLKESKDDRSLYMVDKEDRYYIGLSSKEIDSITKLKRMFVVDDQEDEQDITVIALNEYDSRAGFTSVKYLASFEGSEAKIEFSEDARNFLEERVNYIEMFDFICEIDLTLLGVVDLSFSAIKRFLIESKDRGLISYVEMWEEEIYQLKEIRDISIDPELFSFFLDYDMRGLDSFLGDIY